METMSKQLTEQVHAKATMKSKDWCYENKESPCYGKTEQTCEWLLLTTLVSVARNLTTAKVGAAWFERFLQRLAYI